MSADPARRLPRQRLRANAREVCPQLSGGGESDTAQVVPDRQRVCCPPFCIHDDGDHLSKPPALHWRWATFDFDHGSAVRVFHFCRGLGFGYTGAFEEGLRPRLRALHPWDANDDNRAAHLQELSPGHIRDTSSRASFPATSAVATAAAFRNVRQQHHSRQRR